MNSNLRIYQKSGSALVLVDEVSFYESASFTRSRSGIGSFTITIALDAPKADSFQKRYLVQFGTDLRRIGLIMSVTRGFGEDGKKVLTVSGFEAKGYALQRNILPTTGLSYYTLTDDAETCIKNLLTDSLGSGAATKRRINHVNVTSSGGTGSTYKVSARYDNLGQTLQKIAESSNMGWDFRLNTATGKLDVTTYLGTDRRSSQSVNPRAIFSTDWNSLASAEVSDSVQDIKNLAIVAGQGEGASRVVRDVFSGSEPEADERHEAFVDARDLATNADLDQRGAEFLTENAYTVGIDAEALQVGLTFGTDYDVGDRVTISAFGLTADSYITAATERWGANGYRVSLVFDKPVQTAVQMVNGKATEAQQTLNRIESGVVDSFKNKLINGKLDKALWQRGTSLSMTTAGTNTAYLADRWRGIVAGTSAAATYSRQTFTLGQTDVPGNPEHFLRFDVTNGGDATNGRASLDQAVENVITLGGKTYMLSPWIKANATKSISVEITQYFGTGGSPSADVNTYITKITVGTAWARYLIPIVVPSITGKTIGTTANTSATFVRFWMSAGSAFNARTNSLGIQTGTFDFAMLQLEEGDRATEFEQRPIGVEELLCLRYFYRWVADASTRYIANLQVYQTDAAFGKLFDLPVPMRIAPTATARASTDFIPSLANSSGAGAATFMGFGQNTRTTVGCALTGSSGLVVGNCTVLTTNSSAYVNCDAEF